MHRPFFNDQEIIRPGGGAHELKGRADMRDDGNHLPVYFVQESFQFFLHVILSDLYTVYAILHKSLVFA